MQGKMCFGTSRVTQLLGWFVLLLDYNKYVTLHADYWPMYICHDLLSYCFIIYMDQVEQSKGQKMLELWCNREVHGTNYMRLLLPILYIPIDKKREKKVLVQ